MDDLEGFSRQEIAKLMDICYRAGFIEACRWEVPVTQDIDSQAFKKVCAWFIDSHHPYENVIDLTNHSES